MNYQSTRILGSEDSTLQKLVADQRSTFIGTATLGQSREIVLTIKGFNEYIHVHEGTEFELGRYESAKDHHFNLTLYGGAEHGISRQHAKLYLHNERLYIADMGSTNGTYLRGYRLQPAEPTMIRNGDEVLLGRLPMKIQF